MAFLRNRQLLSNPFGALCRGLADSITQTWKTEGSLIHTVVLRSTFGYGVFEPATPNTFSSLNLFHPCHWVLLKRYLNLFHPWNSITLLVRF